MKHEHKDANKILPYGEILRGLANQGYLVKSDLKKFLRNRGIYFNSSEKEKLVPCISTLLLSPQEFDELREYQNTKEDNFKKNTSRLKWGSESTIFDAVKNLKFDNVIPDEGYNFRLIKEPNIIFDQKNKDKVLIEYELERNDYNKSFYESTNRFKGEIEIERISHDEVKITKSYTSSESNFVGDSLIKIAENYLKENNFVSKQVALKKILFSDFDNEDRIVFFYRLSSNMSSEYFTFKDIVNMEFRPDNTEKLPSEIEWMNNKSELKLRGKSIHDTFFIKEKKYHKSLQFWEMESAYLFKLELSEGSCNVVFSFRDYLNRDKNAEFEINISNFSLLNGPEYSSRDKLIIKNKLLRLFEENKDIVYTKFLKYQQDKLQISDIPNPENSIQN